MELLINAGPGSGKTTLACEIPAVIRSHTIPDWATDEQQAIFQHIIDNHPIKTPSVIFLTFLKEHKKELEKKAPPYSTISTFAACGRSFLCEKLRRTPAFVKNRSHNVIEANHGKLSRLAPKDRNAWWATMKYITFLKRELLDPTEESIEYLQSRYWELKEYKTPTYLLLDRITWLFNELKHVDGQMDYSDMPWVPFYINAYYKKYDYAICDECQDLSTPRVRMARLISRHQFWIGDPCQAINAWDGADCQQFENLERQAEVFTMKKCFRCPPDHIFQANKLIQTDNPVIPMRQDNSPPRRTTLEAAAALLDKEQVPPSDVLFIGRYNYQLISACIKGRLLGLPCYVVGKDEIPDMILKFAKGCVYYQSPSNLPSRMTKHVDEIDLPEYHKSQLRDYVKCIEAVWSPGCTWEELESKLVSLFKPNKSSYRYMTIHKAKGKEAPWVFLLTPIRGKVTDDPTNQEIKCEFVARTRSQQNLFQVSL